MNHCHLELRSPSFNN